MALRIEQDPPQLLDVRPDEVEQRLSGLRPDVAFRGGDGCLAARNQLGKDGRIGLDRSGCAAKQWPGGTLARERPDEAVALEDDLQRVPGQRIGSPPGPQDGGAAAPRGPALCGV